MIQQQYRLNVRYATTIGVAQRRRNRAAPLLPAGARFGAPSRSRSQGAAIRGILIGAPIAAALWVPIVWVASHLL